MKTIKAIAILIVLLVLGSAIVLKMLTVYVPVGHVGVRTQEYAIFGERGVVQMDFGPGWRRDLGPIDSWVFFDGTVQTLEMTKDPERGAVMGRDDVQVQSADGYTVSVDVTITYRIRPGEAHLLYEDTGSKNKHKVIVRNEAEKACISLFGQMKTEDFYDPVERRRRSTEVRELLAKTLADNSVEVLDVLMRDVQFDPEYERKIQRRKLADQEVEYNKSKARAEEMRGITLVVEANTERKLAVIVEQKDAEIVTMRAETELLIATINAEGERYATERRADADLIVAEREAAGELLVKVAEAEGERLRNKAMAGPGGEIMVALEAAGNLNLVDLTVSTLEVDPLDIEAMVTRLGVPPAPAGDEAP